MQFKRISYGAVVGATLLAASAPTALYASSHMDAPLITFDDAANTTDVYAFVSKDGDTQYLTTALAVYPFEEPGIGPNAYAFDDRVRYEIHVALDGDVPEGRRTITYRFEFNTRFANEDTILQSYLGEVQPVEVLSRRVRNNFDANQNRRQTYRVTKIDHRNGRSRKLGRGIVPPNNQGLTTRFYNQGDDGEMPAKEGVDAKELLDPYTRQAIAELKRGYYAFAGQRDDGFYADIQSIFDLDFSFGGGDNPFMPGVPLSGEGKPFDSQGGFNLHTIVLNIPFAELGGAKIAGVYATTSRNVSAAGYRGDDDKDKDDDDGESNFVQVGRQGNPLYAEALIALRDKDRYNQTKATEDDEFAIYAEDPELARVLGTVPLTDVNGNSLIVGIYVPDLIKVDLTTGPARLAGQDGFHRLGVFGGDVLLSQVQDPFGNGGFIPGGWPNGRRFGDDVVDIALLALGVPPLVRGQPVTPADDTAQADFDGVSENDISFNDVFPYAATPLNGRVHEHHDQDEANKGSM